MKKKFSIRNIAEIAIFAAIAFVFDALQSGIAKATMPVLANGGSIGIAMLPILIISYRRGLLSGILCGFIVSLIQMLGGIYVIDGQTQANEFLKTMGPFIQVLFDYVLAYTVVGFAGAFAGLYHKSETNNKKLLFVILGSIVGGLLKYLCHVVSGLIFWPGEVWGISGNAYSFVYNGIYCLPNIVICTLLMVLIAKIYPMFINASDNKKVVSE